eukprot:CAMPEP_0119135322 /NCGR_PEP_ID=MMETSP1310-20130426/19065_1 /TAXON_ID=464262 /ORGANISM="Genus nov. species nov., Strain RCC2339" /LENGTH=194 /DNA_ID=CAMNT_0007126193 /DNA_START=183 /DNA_END=767 /DNA_ORIENTATION=+
MTCPLEDVTSEEDWFVGGAWPPFGHSPLHHTDSVPGMLPDDGEVLHQATGYATFYAQLVLRLEEGEEGGWDRFPGGEGAASGKVDAVVVFRVLVCVKVEGGHDAGGKGLEVAGVDLVWEVAGGVRFGSKGKVDGMRREKGAEGRDAPVAILEAGLVDDEINRAVARQPDGLWLAGTGVSVRAVLGIVGVEANLA